MNDAPAEFHYHLLRHALDQFQKIPSQLEPSEFQQVEAKAERSFALESRALRSPEASRVMIEEAQVEQALQQVAERYADHFAFLADLQANQLDETSLRNALHRELLFDALLRKIAADCPATVNDAEVEKYFREHPEKFNLPEKRAARHILITINSEYPENTRAEVQRRIEELSAELDRGVDFAELAKRFSECPTALQGGQLGEVAPGQLFPQLDAQLFALAENTHGPVVESEVGLHLVKCEKILPARQVTWEQAAPRIRQQLMLQRQRACQKSWLDGLPKD